MNLFITLFLSFSLSFFYLPKVAVNTAAVRTPSLLNELSAHFGSQCTVLTIDVKRKEERKWKVSVFVRVNVYVRVSVYVCV